MNISKETVTHVADLSRLVFSEAEAERLAAEMGEVLVYMETLNQLDTKDVKPTEHILPVQNVFRADEVKPSLPIDEVLANAPDADAGCFKVPRVLE